MERLREGRRNTSMFITASAEIVTSAWSVSGGVMIDTRVKYQWGEKANSQGRRADHACTGGRLHAGVNRGDPAGLGRAWERVFDLITGVQQNMPTRITWRVDLSRVRSNWARGAVEALIWSIAHELDLIVQVEGED